MQYSYFLYINYLNNPYISKYCTKRNLLNSIFHELLKIALYLSLTQTSSSSAFFPCLLFINPQLIYIDIYTYVCICIHILYIYTCVHTYVYMNIYLYISVCAYIYAYICTHIKYIHI